MNKTTEALKLAEEALQTLSFEDEHGFFTAYDVETQVTDLVEPALAAIREALAEQEKQEPVAFALSHSLGLEFSSNYPMCKSKERAEELARQHMGQVVVTPLYAAPVSANREWVELEPWQLCEIEERIGLPIDSHDFETIGNAYIAAFKEKNK